jgi:hypothetical protein
MPEVFAVCLFYVINNEKMLVGILVSMESVFVQSVAAKYSCKTLLEKQTLQILLSTGKHRQDTTRIFFCINT